MQEVPFRVEDQVSHSYLLGASACHCRYSSQDLTTDSDDLEAVAKQMPNDNSGGGQFRIRILKKLTETVNVVYDGYRESHIHAG